MGTPNRETQEHRRNMTGIIMRTQIGIFLVYSHSILEAPYLRFPISVPWILPRSLGVRGAAGPPHRRLQRCGGRSLPGTAAGGPRRWGYTGPASMALYSGFKVSSGNVEWYRIGYAPDFGNSDIALVYQLQLKICDTRAILRMDI